MGCGRSNFRRRERLRTRRRLVAGAGLLAYEINVPFWSDGAVKRRWMAAPPGKIVFRPAGEWMFPVGDGFCQTF